MDCLDSAARAHVRAPSWRKATACLAAAAFVAGLGATFAAAQTPPQQAPQQRTAPNKTPVKNTASNEARHAKCMAFIRNHGLECDPWQQPTCGYDLGIMRPLECAKPF